MAILSNMRATRAAAITPSDTVNIPSVATQDGTGSNGCYVYIGSIAGGATVTVLTIGGDVVTFSGVRAGTILGDAIPIVVKRVNLTGTLASSLVALW